MKNKRLGGGITIISIFYLVSLVVGINRSITSLGALEQINTVSVQAGMSPITSTEVIISMLLSTITLIGVIVTLLKKKIGIYIILITTLLNAIYIVVVNGLNQTTITSAILSFVLPALLFFFILKRKEIYGLEFNKAKKI